MAQTTVNKAYNDGVVTVCRETAASSSFAARQGAESEADLETVCKLDFAENSCREQDSEYANQMGYRLDRKISARKPGNIRIDTECSALIGRTLYAVNNVEYTRTEVYLHLTEVRTFDAESD
ncbi:MAG: hypothetical protein LUE24_13945 [Lachnospiraceae bacterium]|nr:hypothetical protein [Lachnospiraceae bacterium]